MKKYELTEETKLFKGVELHRIKALKDFGDVKQGDLGGWIENEENLSQIGTAWIADNAVACGGATVGGHAIVAGHAVISGHAWISGNAKVYGTAVISGDSKLNGNVRVSVDAIRSDDV